MADVSLNESDEVTIADAAGTNKLTVTVGGAALVDGSGVIQPVSGTVTANQGTANTSSNGWPVKVTDGTNFQPTGDVAARARFNKITDGTNILPTGDVAARSIFTKTSDGTNTQAVEGTPTNAGVTADIAHYLTEQGLYFLGQDFATGIANGATRDVLFITPAAKTAHCRIIFSSKGGNYTLFEAPTTTANGTAITIVNRNRSSATTATCTMFFTPTVTATGTQLAVFSLDTASIRSADYMTQGDEWIFKVNTKYLIRMSSTSGSNVSSVGIYFYEV